MDADNISDIIDVSGFSSDLKTVIDGISSLEAKIAEVNEQSVCVSVDLKGADNMNDLTTGIKQQADAMKELSSIQQDNRNVMLQLAAATEQYGDSATRIAQQVNSTGIEIRQLTSDLQRLQEAQGKAAPDSGTYRQLAGEIANVSGKLGEMVGALRNVSSEMAGLQVNAGKANDSVYSLLGSLAKGMMGDTSSFIDVITKSIDRLGSTAETAKAKVLGVFASFKNAQNNADQEVAFSLSDLDDSRARLSNPKASPRLKDGATATLRAAYKHLLDKYTDDEIANSEYAKEDMLEADRLYKKYQEDEAAYKSVSQGRTDLNNYKNEATLKKDQSGNEPVYNLNALSDFKDQQKSLDYFNSVINIENGSIPLEKKAAMQSKFEYENFINPGNDRGPGSSPKNIPSTTSNTPKALKLAKQIKYDGEYEAQMAEAKKLADMQKAVADDEKQHLDDRLLANKNYFTLLGAYADAAKRKEENDLAVDIKNSKGDPAKLAADGEKKKQAIKDKYADEANKRELQQQKRAEEIQKDDQENWFARRQQGFAQEQAYIIEQYLQQEQALKDSLDKKKITQEDYEKHVEDLQNRKKQSLNNHRIVHDNDLLKSGRLTQDQAIDMQNDRNRAVAGNLEIKPPAPDDKVKQQWKEFYLSLPDYAREAMQAIKQIQDNQFAHEQQQLEIKQRQVELQSQQQMEAIDATAGFAITKDNEKAKLAAQTTAQENSLQQQQNQLALKKAKADKQSAEMNVIASTAEAIMKVWAGYAGQEEVGAALAIAETAVIAGVGAAQFAAAASMPLPQFAKGGITTTPFFIAGEAGPEIIAAPGKRPYITNGAAIYSEPAGTAVVPMDKMLDYAAGHAAAGKNYQAELQGIYNNDMMMREVAKIVGDKFDDIGGEIVKAQWGSRPRVPDAGKAYEHSLRYQYRLK